MFKKIFKGFLIIGGVLSVLYSLYALYRFYKNQELLQLYIGMGKVDKNQQTLSKVSASKSKFVGLNQKKSIDAFDEYMEEQGWHYLAQYGRCALYEQFGREVLVRTTPLFQRYMLFEVLDSKYVRDFDENLLEIA